jgi:error-prone DNA polymerase
MKYAELHCHSYYSFHDGASSLEELLVEAKRLGYQSLALTDHDNLCAAMRFSHLARSVGLQGIIGAEITLRGGFHLTLLVENAAGYRNLCRLITAAHEQGERNKPELPPSLLAEHATGLIVLSGCPRGELSLLVASSRLSEARRLIAGYLDWFGPDHYYLELQNNLVIGDFARNKMLFQLGREMGVPVVATGNVHYHIRMRHHLQDCLVAIRHCKSLGETHQERRGNSEFYLRPMEELYSLHSECPEALANTIKIAGRCSFDLTTGSNYALPEYPVPDGFTPESYLKKLCQEAAIRRYGAITPEVKSRLDEEFQLVKKCKLEGFLLLYHDINILARQAMVDQGLCEPLLPLEENPPGRGRGSSVALLIGYLIGLSHIDPLKYKLSLERFLPDDTMTNAPDIDLDFPRSIREELILRTHRKWGWRNAALTGTIVTYRIRGAVRDLGKALRLPPEEIDQLSKQLGWGSARHLSEEMQKSEHFKDKVNQPVWRDLISLAFELDGFPKCLGQHPGGMIISSTSLSDMVPIQRGAIANRYICQWDKDDIDDAGFVKIDFLALGALSQMQEVVEIVKKNTGKRLDMSRIDFEDTEVYDMLCRSDTIGIFQVESAAQMQTINRLRPRNLLDMAHEVAAVRPGVGVNGGVQEYLARRGKKKPVIYDHGLERRSLERTLGVVLFQDQINQLAIDVAGFVPGKADQMRRAFSRHHNQELITRYREEFLEGATRNGVSEDIALRIFGKFNGQYMFPESHAFAFGITAYQASWLKLHYPLEFFLGLFNQQPMGFYNLETLKEDAIRHGVKILNPDINKSHANCTIDNGAIRLGFLNVTGLGNVAAKSIEMARDRDGSFQDIGDFLRRTCILEEVAFSLAGAGAFESLQSNRRMAKWEIGLRYQPINAQLLLNLPVEQDMLELETPTDWEVMKEEYNVLSLCPGGHVMSKLRPSLPRGVVTSRDIKVLKDGADVTTAGLVIRRQRPRKVVFFTLEDEFGHIPCMVFPNVYERYFNKFRSAFMVVRGKLTQQEGTLNLVVNQVRPFNALEKVPVSKDWH